MVMNLKKECTVGRTIYLWKMNLNLTSMKCVHLIIYSTFVQNAKENPEEISIDWGSFTVDESSQITSDNTQETPTIDWDIETITEDPNQSK